MELLFTVAGIACMLGAALSFLAMFDVFRGREKIRASLLEFKDSNENDLRASPHTARTGRLTGGFTPGKGMIYVPSDELIDSI